MKRFTFMLCMAMASAVAGFCGYYFAALHSTRLLERENHAELEWLHREFRLTDDRFDSIRRLEAAYEQKFANMYRRIEAADAQAERVIATSATVTPEVENALHNCALVQEECRREALLHVYEVAAQMPREEGLRYLKSMLTSILEPGVQPIQPVKPAATVLARNPK